MSDTNHTLAQAGILEFTLDDADGKPHKYVCPRHPAEQGLSILYRLAGHLSGAIGAALAGMVETLADTGSVKDLLDADLASHLGKLDMGAAGQELAKSLLSPDSVRLTRDLLALTSRDGQKLHSDTAFSVAYSGNYAELMSAAWRVIQHNRFLPFSRTSTAKE